MIARVNRSMFRSGVIDAKTGGTTFDSIRTSYGGVIQRAADAIIASIEERIAEWTHLPADHGESFQVRRAAAAVTSSKQLNACVTQLVSPCPRPR